jgi:hypothetical protein
MNRPTLPQPQEPPCVEIINEAAHSITDHMIDYGEPAANYERASALVSLILGKPITPYEIAMIKLAVKLSRIAETPDLRRNYVEMIACAALAGEFMQAGPVTAKRMATALKPEPAPVPPSTLVKNDLFRVPSLTPRDFTDEVEHSR